MLTCFICHKELLDIKRLRSHFQLIHNPKELSVYICAQDNNCKRRFQLFNSFRRHIIRDHNSAGKVNIAVPPNQQSIDLSYQTSAPPQDIVVNQQSSLSPQFTHNLETVEKELSIFIASLYANQSLSRNIVQTIISGFHNFVKGSLLSAIKQRLEILSSKENDSGPSNRNKPFDSIKPLLTNLWSLFDTEYKRIKYFVEKQTFIQPESIVIGERLEKVKRMGISRFVPITCEQHFIPLRKVLKSFFSLQNVLSETLDYMNRLTRDCDLENAAIENFIQGSFWCNRMKMQQCQDKIIIPLFIFFDDYETGNALGSRSGQHKLGAVYASIPCLTPFRLSTLSNIFLVLLFHSSDRVKFGNKIIFRCVIDELNFLSEHGIEFNVPNFSGVVYFELGLIIGDNLGIHAITGFQESFSANLACRTCKVRKEVSKIQCYENKDLLRTFADYEADLLLNNASETGIKEKCIWLDVKNFDLFNQLGIDCMHDILEGVAKYVMQFILLQYLRRFKLFSLSLLNNRIHAFEYGPDSRNQPCTLAMEHLARGNVRMTASEMLTFLRYFPLLVGEFVPRGDEVWELYKKLRAVLEMVLSTAFAKGTEELLQTAVAELNAMYMSLSKDSLKPKFHHMVHYHTALKNYGPIVYLWSMRFEAKHRSSKMAAIISCNKRNITLTVSKKHQLHMNEIFLKGQLVDPLKIGPIVRAASNDAEEKQFLCSYLQLCLNKSLDKVSWATVCSTRYVKGTILVYDTNSDFAFPVFFKVQHVYLYDSEHLILMGIALQTVEFDYHFYAYEVKESKKSRNVAKLHSSLVSPIPCNINILSNGKKYVTLRCTI